MCVKLKYHKIRNVPLEICTAEQKIAYNLAWRAHLWFGDQYDSAKKEGNPYFVLQDFLIREVVPVKMKHYKMAHGNEKYNIDAIYAALCSGIKEYFDNYFIAENYEQIGKVFKADYL